MTPPPFPYHGGMFNPFRKQPCKACVAPSWDEVFTAVAAARDPSVPGRTRPLDIPHLDLLTRAVGERDLRHHHVLRARTPTGRSLSD